MRDQSHDTNLVDQNREEDMYADITRTLFPRIFLLLSLPSFMMSLEVKLYSAINFSISHSKSSQFLPASCQNHIQQSALDFSSINPANFHPIFIFRICMRDCKVCIN